MMNFLKQYWYWILLILLAPIAINFILLIPVFSPITGDDKTWLAFWGNYLGGILPAFGAFIILAIQRRDNEKQNRENRETNALENEENRKANKKENDKNRVNQNKILSFYVATQDLHLFKESCIMIYNAYCYNRFVQICNLFTQESKSPLDLIRIGFSDVSNAHRVFLMNLLPSGPKMEALIKEENRIFKYYNSTLLDLEVITSNLNSSKNHIKSHTLIDKHASEILQQIIKDNFETLENTEPKKWLNQIINKRLDVIDVNLTISLWELISEAYLNEKKRINEILIKNGTEQIK